LVLREVLPDTPGLAGRRQARVAHSQRGDFQSGRQVAFLESRRNAQDIGDIVEAECRIVWRKERADIDVKAKKVADGVSILRSIQTMER
jgi:hypothetical protein